MVRDVQQLILGPYILVNLRTLKDAMSDLY